jgi:hypothetical protein
MGASYGFVKNVAANIREHDDPWNAAAGGFVAGALSGAARSGEHGLYPALN